LRYKTKQFFFFLIKLAIVVGAFYFIYNKTVHNEHISGQNFIAQLEDSVFSQYKTLFFLLCFTLVNWLFEILKWQILISSLRKISLYEAFQQSLGSLTASLFTPNRIGEYGAKAMYYKKGNRRKVMLLNLMGNMTQMTITVLLGGLGLLYFILNFDVNFEIFRFRKTAYIFALVLVTVLAGSIGGYKKIRGFYIDKIIDFIKKIPLRIHSLNGIFSVLRYLVFSHQFYFLLLIFDIEVNYFAAMSLITTMYLLASLVPSLAFLDWLIKGSVAIWVFGFIQVNELVIFTITLLMWVLNFGLPAIIGSYFVLNFNFSNQK